MQLYTEQVSFALNFGQVKSQLEILKQQRVVCMLHRLSLMWACHEMHKNIIAEELQLLKQ